MLLVLPHSSSLDGEKPLFFYQQENFDIPEVAIRHFRSAINRIRPSDVKFFQDLAAQFRRFVDDASRRKQ